MWQILSYRGRFDPLELRKLPNIGDSHPGERTAAQKEKRRAAVEARAEYRLAQSIARLRDRIRNGNGKPLTTKQQKILDKLDDGSLLQESNRLTQLAGHGRLKRTDGTFVDIGGSTGGYFRTQLCDWSPPDTSEWATEV